MPHKRAGETCTNDGHCTPGPGACSAPDELNVAVVEKKKAPLRGKGCLAETRGLLVALLQCLLSFRGVSEW